MNEIEKALRDAGTPRWKDIMANESVLLPLIRLYQSTMRVAGLIPIWQVFAESKAWWEIVQQLDSTEQRKFKAWWEVSFVALRHPKDVVGCAFAIAHVVREAQRRSYSKEIEINAEQHGITDPAYIEAVQKVVADNINDLLTVDLNAKTDLGSMLAPKFDRNFKEKLARG